jgi:hypothetical protein
METPVPPCIVTGIQQVPVEAVTKTADSVCPLFQPT